MRIAVLSSKTYDREFLEPAITAGGYDAVFFEPRLTPETAGLAAGFDAVCAFVNDRLDDEVLGKLARGGTRIVALRCAGFNNVDLSAAERHGVTVVRVPAYSPHSVAEHAVALLLTLDRKVHRAYARVREGNFSLAGLMGFDLYGRTVGVVGTGKIGSVFSRIMAGFGCRLLGHDPAPNAGCESLGMVYVPLDELFARSDIVSLHCPLTSSTRHMIDAAAVARMKPGVVLLNTGRGAVVDARAVIDGLKVGRIGGLGLDVYEEEADYFFEDLSDRGIAYDVLARLLTFPNVVVTGHQGFFTKDALGAIAETTVRNLRDVAETGRSANQLTAVPAR